MDKIFLLSAEEYEKYHEHIPYIACYWWLRTPIPNDKDDVVVVDSDGDVNDWGTPVNDTAIGVRPAIEISEELASFFSPGGQFEKDGWRWTYLGDNIAIATIPIEFQYFDIKSNDYETSGVRKYLRQWHSVECF